MKLTEALKKIIGKNLGWKLLSFVFASLLWFVVMNLNNPTETKIYTVNLSILNEDKLTENNYTILNYEELEQTKVSIRIKASRSALDELNRRENKNAISAVIDLKQFDILYTTDGNDPVSINITPKMPESIISDMYEIENFYPTSVKLNIDNIITIKRSVNIIQNGEISSGYTAYPPEAEPQTVSITGPSTKINSVKQICAYLNADKATSSMSISSKVYALDSSKQPVDDLSIEPENVTISMKISKHDVLNVAVPEVTGSPAEGFEFEGIICEPNTVDILGTPAEVSSLVLPSIDISGLSSDRTFEFDAKDYINDSSISLRNSNTKINVTVKIAQRRSLNVSIPPEQITISGYDSSEYEISADRPVNLTLSALSDKFEGLNIADIKGYADLSGLSLGSHRVNVRFDLPEGINIEGSPMLSVEIFEKEKTETTTEETTKETTTETTTETAEETTSEAVTETETEETTTEDAEPTFAESTAKFAEDEYVVSEETEEEIIDDENDDNDEN